MQEAGLNQCFSASLVIFKFFYKDVYGDRRYPMALSNRDDKWSSLAVKHTLQLSLIFTSKVHYPPWSQLHFTEKSEAKKCQPIKQGNIPLATIFCFKKTTIKRKDFMAQCRVYQYLLPSKSILKYCLNNESS